MAYIYLETAKGSGLFNCRGETDGDAASFAFTQARGGLRTFAAAKHLGEFKVPIDALKAAKAKKVIGVSVGTRTKGAKLDLDA